MQQSILESKVVAVTPSVGRVPSQSRGPGQRFCRHPPIYPDGGLCKHIFTGRTPCALSTQSHVNMCPGLTRLLFVTGLSYIFGNELGLALVLGELTS